MGYWPSYSTITPGARAAYLRWLAGGRCDPNIHVGFVFLYFYGLERRLLVDSKKSAVAVVERESLLAEVRRLLSIYRDNGSFRSYAQDLLNAMTVLSAGADVGAAPTPTGEWSSELPSSTRLVLARLGAAGAPVPADWALAWVTQLPDTYLRTPATRCLDLFVQVFDAYYRERYGEGVVLRAGKRPLSAHYRPASSGIASVTIDSEQLREVGDQAGVLSVLRQLVDSATTDLDPYSRYLGRHPDGGRDSAAIALLPATLPAPDNAAVDELYSWAAVCLRGARQAVSSMADLVQHWPESPATGKLLKADFLVVAQLLDKRGLGIEPDVRFGGTPPGPDKPIVLFHRAEQQVQAPNPAYAAALATVNMGMLVAAADGVVLDAELDIVRGALESLDLSGDERLRLEAHATLVAANPPTAAVLRRRLAVLPDTSRSAAGRLLIAVASVDGTITADEVASLERLFGSLGLDASQIYSTLHLAATTEASPDDVVTMRTAGSPATRTPLTVFEDPVPTGLALDPVLLAAKRAESMRAAAQLAGIFVEDATDEETSQSAQTTPSVASVAGLDASHSSLFHLLVERESWSRSAAEDVITGLGLLPDGALEVLNEAAYDRVDGPLWEGTDVLTIDQNTAKGMRE